MVQDSGFIMFVIFQGLQEHLQTNSKKYTAILAIEPTGWTHSKNKTPLSLIKPKLKKDNVTIYGRWME